jgi:hypothetical protein
MNEEEMNELTEFYELLKIAERIGDDYTKYRQGFIFAPQGGLGRSCGYIRDSRMYLDEDDLRSWPSNDMYADSFDNGFNARAYGERSWMRF